MILQISFLKLSELSAGRFNSHLVRQFKEDTFYLKGLGWIGSRKLGDSFVETKFGTGKASSIDTFRNAVNAVSILGIPRLRSWSDKIQADGENKLGNVGDDFLGVIGSELAEGEPVQASVILLRWRSPPLGKANNNFEMYIE